jgi:hypothetical protein
VLLLLLLLFFAVCLYFVLLFWLCLSVIDVICIILFVVVVISSVNVFGVAAAVVCFVSVGASGLYFCLSLLSIASFANIVSYWCVQW